MADPEKSTHELLSDCNDMPTPARADTPEDKPPPRPRQADQLIELVRDRDSSHERRHQELIQEMRELRKEMSLIKAIAPTRGELRLVLVVLLVLLLVMTFLYANARGEDPRVAAEAVQRVIQPASDGP